MSATMGIDPSLNSTAYSILLDGEHNETITIQPKKLYGIDRLMYIEEQLNIVCDKVGEIDLLCLEGYAFCRPNQAHQIGELGGIIRRLLWLRDISWIEIAPPTLKKFATGKGSAKKEQVMAHVYKRWGIMFDNSDKADAFVLAKIAEHVFTGSDEGLTQIQIDALVKPREAYRGVE